MDALSELISVCRAAADTEKVTERKKRVEKLRNLLGKKHITKSLDKCSDEKIKDTRLAKKLFGWDSLFHVVKNLLWHELEILKKSKNTESGAAQKRKQEVCAVFKLVVKQASKGKARLKGHDVVKHITEIMHDDFTREQLGVDHSNILLKHILCQHKYWSELPQLAWHELLILYCGLLRDHGSLNRVLVSRVIYNLMNGAVKQCDIKPVKLFSMLQEYLSNVKKEKSVAVVEYMVSTVNLLFSSVAKDCRSQIARVGEGVMVQLLYLWKNRPSDRLKDDLVEFMRLQMCVHHPMGARNVNEGAFAVNMDSWMSNLRRLYDVLYTELEELGGRNKFTKKSRDNSFYHLKPNFIDLAADVCHQLFKEDMTSLEVTILDTTVAMHDGHAAKKRRLESGWTVLYDRISTCGATIQAISWLQLVECIVLKYPCSIPPGQYMSLVSVLHQTLEGWKRAEVSQAILQCLQALANAKTHIKGEMTVGQVDEDLVMWRKVWTTVTRMLKLHHCPDSCFDLLSKILLSHQLKPDKDTWGIFLPNSNVVCSNNGLLFLAGMLQCHELPESFARGCITERPLLERHALRGLLLDWLLPDRDSHSSQSKSPLLNPALKAEILLAIAFRDLKLKCDVNTCDRKSAFINEKLVNLSKCYIQTTFDDTVHPHSQESISADDTREGGSGHFSVVLERLYELIHRETDDICDTDEHDIHTLVCVIQQLCVNLHILALLASNLAQTDITKNPLVQHCKSLGRELCETFRILYQKDHITDITSALIPLTETFHMTTQPTARSVLYTVIKEDFIQWMLTIVSDHLKRCSKSQSNNNNLSRLNSTTSAYDDMDDLDMGFEGPGYHDDEDDDWGETAASSESQDRDFEVSSLEKGVVSLMTTSTLTDKDALCLQIIRLACAWCGVQKGADIAPPCVESQRHLADLLDEEETCWDAGVTLHLHVLRTLMEEMCSRCDVQEDDIAVMLDALRTMCKVHRKDQELCGLVLDLLARVAPHLADSDMVSESIQESRNIALHICGVFWKLSKEDQYKECTRHSLIECLLAFIQCDPYGEWTFWRVRDPPPGEKTHQYLSEEIVSAVCDLNVSVRLRAADIVTLLFLKNKTLPSEMNSAAQQGEMFDLVYSTLQNVCSVEGRLTAEQLQDERHNRMCGALRTLAAIACTSVTCEKKCIFACVQVLKEHNFEVDMVKKVMRRVSRSLGYSCYNSLMTSHLAYLTDQWLDSDYGIQDFPYQLCDVSSRKQFYLSYYEDIMPQLIMRQDEESMTSISREAGLEMREMVRTCIPRTLIHILPLFAVSGRPEAEVEPRIRRKLVHANKCYEFMSKLIDVKQDAIFDGIIEECIGKQIDTLTRDLLMTLYYPEGGAGDCPEPNPPFYNSTTITATLDYLKKGHGENTPSLISIICKKEDGIQKILLALSTFKTHHLHERGRRLSIYKLFVGLLLNEFHQELGGSWAFVLRSVVFTVINNIGDILSKKSVSTQEELQVTTNLEILTDLCRVAAECCPQELCRFLSDIVNTLVNCEERCGEQGASQSHQLLKYLLVERAGDLRASIAKLDPLPEHEAFSTARKVHHKLKYESGKFTFIQEIRHFLGVDNANSPSRCRLEALKFLNKQLQKRKNELAKLIKGETEMEQEMLVHLVRTLITLSQRSDPDIQQQCGQCLGQIGPTDLPVDITGTHTDHLKQALDAYEDKPELQKYCTIIHALYEYLVDKETDVVCSSSDVLKTLLSTKPGIAFYKDYKSRVSDHIFQYLHPFKATKKKAATVASSSQESSFDTFSRMVNSKELWLPFHNDHRTWITNLVCTLIESTAVRDDVLRKLVPICRVKYKFCETILPFLIHDILEHGTELHRETLSLHAQIFFNKHVTDFKGTDKGDVDTHIHLNPESVKCMLNVIQYLRLQERPALGRGAIHTSWDNNFWLDIDYLSVAQAAHNCSAYFTAIMFAEIWCYNQRNLPEDGSMTNTQASSQFSQDTQLDSLSSGFEPGSMNVQNLMLETYRCIGHPDGVYGCGAGRLPNIEARIKTYEHECNWNKALGSYDLMMSSGRTPNLQLGLMQTLEKLGTSHVLETYLQGVPTTGSQGEELELFRYQAACRMASWDRDPPTRLDTSLSYDKALYSSLAALHENEPSVAIDALRIARTSALHDLTDSSLESMKILQPALAKLLCVNEAEVLLKGLSDLKNPLLEWNQESTVLAEEEFDMVEVCLQQRCVLLQLLLDLGKGDKVFLEERLVQHCENLAREARVASRHQISEAAIHRLRSLCSQGIPAASQDNPSWQIEESRVFWARGEHDIAKHLMKSLIRKFRRHEDSEDKLVWYGKCLGIYGEWLAETRSESPYVVMEQYLCEAVQVLEMYARDDEASIDTYLSLARYADGQYQDIVNYQQSSTFEEKQELIQKAKEDMESLKRMGDKSSRYVRTIEKQLQIDESEMSNMERDRLRYLKCAIENYIKCMVSGNTHDMRMFRLTSLWFDNCTVDNINKIIERKCSDIVSHKFIPLMYQWAARMNKNNSADLFQRVLLQMIERTVADHPHHTLFIILALANANKDAELAQIKTGGRRGRAKSMASEETEGEEGRVSAAKCLIEKLRGNAKVNKILQDMERLCIAYIQLANWNVEQFKRETKALTIPSVQQITNMKNLNTVAVPTSDTRIEPGCDYHDIVHIHKFEDTFKLAGGINLPKIIKCIGSDGQAYRQLVKGRDDLRQDAVMQQVFGMVNTLLQKNAETRKRKLHVRRYKVIPLSQNSGLLEWCEGTIPLGAYLIGDGGAHERYRPHDFKAIDCRKAMMQYNRDTDDSRRKMKSFLQICKKFQPVLRHFFMEYFREPRDWYSRRLAYTRSVATNSIVGYILGLGDRHVQNILLDTHTGEMVHIDLGVAFEQGKILPTPETVPFRLTRDIVDGMGVAGVEGVFRRSCEKTMSVMHSNQESLLTILQVLLYDPLSSWTLSPEKAVQLQQMKADLDTTGECTDMPDGGPRESRSVANVNKVAKRVLLRLQQKLQGVEGVQLSLQGQVNHLIQEGRNPENLCRLFPGWQPYI